jgi:hypothetical protein
MGSVRSNPVSFAVLVAAQAAHSIEEYLGRLWESFPPASFLTGLVSADREVGFIVINSALVMFGLWCLIWPVRRNWQSATALAWFWVVLETVNGIGHIGWSLGRGAYTPGLLTAPVLFVSALYLASRLRQRPEGLPLH